MGGEVGGGGGLRVQVTQNQNAPPSAGTVCKVPEYVHSLLRVDVRKYLPQASPDTWICPVTFLPLRRHLSDRGLPPSRDHFPRKCSFPPW